MSNFGAASGRREDHGSQRLYVGGVYSGDSTNRTALGTDADNGVQLYFENTGTSGDFRSVYTRMYWSGAGGAGEALRAYGIVNNVTAAIGGTVNGSHISLKISGASGKISGSGNAMRATLEVDNASANVGGTVAVLRLDTSMVASATIPALTSYIAFDNLDSTKINYLFNITNASTTMFATAGTTAGSAGDTSKANASKVLKISVGGVDYWIPLFASNS